VSTSTRRGRETALPHPKRRAKNAKKRICQKKFYQN
jgi:hypothetical protein